MLLGCGRRCGARRSASRGRSRRTPSAARRSPATTWFSMTSSDCVVSAPTLSLLSVCDLRGAKWRAKVHTHGRTATNVDGTRPQKSREFWTVPSRFASRGSGVRFPPAPATKPQVRAGSSDLFAGRVLGSTHDWAKQEAVDLYEDRHMSEMR